ncbi:OmpA family protein [Vibrio sp. ZSDE26]|uniref:OmpA family protein n=1 Tax=Vibrio amylolyticus TaxID=2847292 RepID=A0A9X1XKX7_9VIBR|nr:OmpA family protein [Vibrio amylolyticus]MCK6265182.1 OmpA family protein [Vibrio amylolyticus]
MKKHLIGTLVATYIFTAPVLASDEYEYIETPVAIQVEDLLDDDKDGVINARDLCVETPLASEIDNDGCETHVKTEEQMKLNILFGNDSAELNSVFLGQVRAMAEFLEGYPSTSIELQGFASKTGSAEYNLNLSKKRANSIKDALISNGVSHTRITIVGYGDTSLSAFGDDEQSHALNRKVEATVVGYKGSVKEAWTIFNKIAK